VDESGLCKHQTRHTANALCRINHYEILNKETPADEFIYLPFEGNNPEGLVVVLLPKKTIPG
jgi:hypothetical protein